MHAQHHVDIQKDRIGKKTIKKYFTRNQCTFGQSEEITCIKCIERLNSGFVDDTYTDAEAKQFLSGRFGGFTIWKDIISNILDVVISGKGKVHVLSGNLAKTEKELSELKNERDRTRTVITLWGYSIVKLK